MPRNRRDYLIHACKAALKDTSLIGETDPQTTYYRLGAIIGRLDYHDPELAKLLAQVAQMEDKCPTSRSPGW